MARVKRKRLHLSDEGGNYFTSSSGKLKFIHTGAAVLDCSIGWGWPLGRIINIVGDQSTGKTLLAIEAMANFALQYKRGRIRYREAEAAFIPEYAGALGLPLDRVEFSAGEGGEADTVEKFYNDLSEFLKKLKGKPGLYILDSLDAISDEAEVAREFGEATYGTAKAKYMSELFRKITRKVESSKVSLMIISQTRDRIGGGFGRKYARTGGKALDFYASIILYLAHIGELPRTVNGIKRSVGIKIRAKCTKNKVGLPFRGCDFPILFAYGIEDITAGIDWLKANKCLSKIDMTNRDINRLRKRALRLELSKEEYKEYSEMIGSVVRANWQEIETSFLPKRGKYV